METALDVLYKYNIISLDCVTLNKLIDNDVRFMVDMDTHMSSYQEVEDEEEEDIDV